jgi:hypothetical protein
MPTMMVILLLTVDKIIEKRIADIMRSFGKEGEKIKNTLRYMPKRKGRAVGAVRTKRQIDFRTFYEDFYSKSVARNVRLGKVSSNVAWSEIRTKIKGGSFEYFKATGGAYNSNDSKMKSAVKTLYKTLQSDDKLSDLVFDIFESYESWKNDNDYFDIEDFVGLFYKKISKWPFKEFNFDFVIVDEVQDLSFNSISVLTNLCLNNFMICGDNAQNIEKGINFKFKDLKNFLETSISNRSEKIVDYGDYYNQSQNLPFLEHYHLGLNFRSSKQILDLANIVVCLLETYFGNEIDSFPKERGYFSSPKPLLVELGADPNFLLDLLEKYLKMEVETDAEPTASNEQPMEDSTVVLGRKAKIGNDFCIIVRNEAAKAAVPASLRNCIILTLQESKGLEFENVLLFNHFTQNDSEKGWRFIHSRTTVQERKQTSEEKRDIANETDLFRRNKLELQKLVREDNDSLFEFSTNAALGQMSTQAQLEGLSADLKFLYVAVTRAKKNLIIYDYCPTKPTSHIRIEFDNMCTKFGVADVVGPATLKNFEGLYQADPNWKAAQQNLAREKGYCFLKQGEYHAAERFFKVSSDAKLIKYCKASEKAKAAGDLLSIEFDDELKKKYASIVEMQKDVYQRFLEAAKMFEELEKYNEAGKCYFSAESYVNAAECFRKADNKIYLSHSLFMDKKYDVALPLYYELEQDDMVQACLINLSDGGKDMSKFAALLASMSDEVKEVAKYDDDTFLRFIRNVFDEVTAEMREEQEKESLADRPEEPQKENTEEMADKEPSQIEAIDDSQSDSFQVVTSEKNDKDDFLEIKSVISEIKGSGGSFENLASINSLSLVEQKGFADKVLARLDTHKQRLLALLQSFPGSDILFSRQDPSLKKIMFDLCTVFCSEDLGLQLFSEAGDSDIAILDRLIIGKLLRLDTNLCVSRKVDPLSKITSTKSEEKNIREMVTLNIFEIMSVFKFNQALRDAYQLTDDIIKHLFFHIGIMGLAEYFFPLTASESVRKQLSLFIHPTIVKSIELAEAGEESQIKNVPIEPTPSYSALAFSALFANVVKRLQKEDLGASLSKKAKKNGDGFKELLQMLKEVFARPVVAEGTALEALDTIEIEDCGRVISLLRLILKRQAFIQGSDRDAIIGAIYDWIGARSGKEATFAGNKLSGFVFLTADSWILELGKRIPDVKNVLKLDTMPCWLHPLSQTNPVLLVQADKIFELAFIYCTYHLLTHISVKNQNHIISLEVFSRLTNAEKSALRFNRLFPKKSEDLLVTFESNNHSLAVLEDYLYSKTLSHLKKGSATSSTPGTPENVNFFAIYQNFALLNRNLKSNKVAAHLIKEEVKNIKSSRLFFLLEEVDDLLKSGELAMAYFKLQDLIEFCEQNQVDLYKKTGAWLALKELLILVVANGLEAPKSDEAGGLFSRTKWISVSTYFKAELEGMSWIARAGDQYYLLEDKINHDRIPEILLNVGGKVHDLTSNLPKATFSICADLEPWVHEINTYAASHCPNGKNQLTLDLPDYIKLRRASALDNPAAIAPAIKEKEADIAASKLSDQEAEKIAKGIFSKIQLHKKIKVPGGTSLSSRLQVAGDNKKKVFVAKGIKQPLEELCLSESVRNRTISILLSDPILSPLDYNFLYSILDNIDAGRVIDDRCDNIIRIHSVALKEKKRLDTYIEDKRKQMDSKSKREVDRLQDEVKNRLKLISMVGGQVYWRIANRLKNKDNGVTSGIMKKKK